MKRKLRGLEEAGVVHCLGTSRDSLNDALWDLDAFHGDEFLQLVQTGNILYLAAKLGAATRATCTQTYAQTQTHAHTCTY